MGKNYDVIFIGGSLMAASTVYSLLNENPKMKVVLIEKDPTYKHAATTLALGGFRQQFSARINIRMARNSIKIFENFSEIMETNFGKPQIELKKVGYLFLIDKKKWDVALKNSIIQKEEGVELEILSPKQLADMIPNIDLRNIAGGTVCRHEGILDPQQLLFGYIKKIKEFNARFIYDEVVEIKKNKGRIQGVICKSGRTFESESVVNASGPWAGEVGKMAGVEVPVKPLPHDIYVCEISKDLKIADSYTTVPSETWWFREYPDRNILYSGKSKWDFSFSFNFTPDRDFFYNDVWPSLVERYEGFDAIRLVNAWRGCYEYNYIDQNAIIGEHPHLKGFYLINGFSGHGMMQAPAAGKGLAELILYSKYKTLDFNEIGLERIFNNKLIIEQNII